MITVIIPTINDPYLVRTINDVEDNASDELEFVIVNDGGDSLDFADCTASNVRVLQNIKQLGRRVSINEAARIAKGSYLFILDAHCKMTKDWDKRLLEACQDNTIVVSTIQDMEPDMWKLRPGLYHHCYLNTKYTEKWWHKAENTVEEMMCFTGCAWLIPKDYYWKLGGYDESLGKYGWDGPEWSLKVWLNEEYPGSVLLRSDVICGHVFGTNDGNKLYSAETIGESNWIKYAKNKWGQKVKALVEKFNPPDWAKEPEVKKEEKKKIKVYHTTINKIDECEDEDENGKVVRKYKKIYKPFVVDHDGTKTESQIAEIATPQITEVEKEEECVMSS